MTILQAHLQQLFDEEEAILTLTTPNGTKIYDIDLEDWGIEDYRELGDLNPVTLRRLVEEIVYDITQTDCSFNTVEIVDYKRPEFIFS